MDLAIAYHKVWGDHVGYSAVWWNGPDGFDERRVTKLPTSGPHGMISVEPRNTSDGGNAEFYRRVHTRCRRAARWRRSRGWPTCPQRPGCAHSCARRRARLAWPWRHGRARKVREAGSRTVGQVAAGKFGGPGFNTGWPSAP